MQVTEYEHPDRASLRQAPAAAPEQTTPPALWNPNAAANWSLVFSPVFGSLLIRSNLAALGEVGMARRAAKWAIATMGWEVLQLLLPDGQLANKVRALASLVWLLTWYYVVARPHIRDVKARFGPAYPRRKWSKPFALTFLGLAGLCVLAGILSKL
jgi:hypothetical protein